MTYRTFRRRLSEATAAHDWLEGVSLVLGLAFLALAVLCVWGVVTGIVNIGDAEAPPGTPATVGFLEVTRGFAMVLFALFGFVAFGVGWFLAGATVKRWFGRGKARAKDRG
jgi:ABC-type amino acid transport system permease subunit